MNFRKLNYNCLVKVIRSWQKEEVNLTDSTGTICIHFVVDGKTCAQTTPTRGEVLDTMLVLIKLILRSGRKLSIPKETLYF